MAQTKMACDLQKGAGLFPLLSLLFFKQHLRETQYQPQIPFVLALIHQSFDLLSVCLHSIFSIFFFFYCRICRLHKISDFAIILRSDIPWFLLAGSPPGAASGGG